MGNLVKGKLELFMNRITDFEPVLFFNQFAGRCSIVPVGDKESLILSYNYPIAYIKKVGKLYYALIDLEQFNSEQTIRFQNKLLEQLIQICNGVCVRVDNVDDLIGFADSGIVDWTQQNYDVWKQNMSLISVPSVNSVPQLPPVTPMPVASPKNNANRKTASGNISNGLWPRKVNDTDEITEYDELRPMLEEETEHIWARIAEEYDLDILENERPQIHLNNSFVEVTYSFDKDLLDQLKKLLADAVKKNALRYDEIEAMIRFIGHVEIALQNNDKAQSIVSDYWRTIEEKLKERLKEDIVRKIYECAHNLIASFFRAGDKRTIYGMYFAKKNLVALYIGSIKHGLQCDPDYAGYTMEQAMIRVLSHEVFHSAHYTAILNRIRHYSPGLDMKRIKAKALAYFDGSYCWQDCVIESSARFFEWEYNKVNVNFKGAHFPYVMPIDPYVGAYGLNADYQKHGYVYVCVVRESLNDWYRAIELLQNINFPLKLCCY